MKIYYQIVLIFVFILVKVDITSSVDWKNIPCSKDPDQSVTEGSVANIGRFPWLGVVQHNFYVGGRNQFAVTTGLLIHPGYAIAPAEDMGSILRDNLVNNTNFIIWYNSTVKYVLEVSDYFLHPEYEREITLATIAILELVTHGETSITENKAAVSPVCLPFSGAVTLSDMYAVKMSDETTELQKEMYMMKYVSDRDCAEFYEKHNLTYAKMSPVAPLCAATERALPSCVWDSGAALITRQSWGFWKILGFSVRGPGCGAPARFLVIHDYLKWIDDILTPADSDNDDEEGVEEENILGFRRLSPIKIVMYNAKKALPSELGQCDRKLRGGVLYKESFELTMTKDFGQGFFYVIVTQIAQFRCGLVNFDEVTAKTNTALWVEHYCHREMTGIAHGHKKPRIYHKLDCFMYFKSAAFVKFRFYFSFRAFVEMTLYGVEEIPRIIPNPFITQETTDYWKPTNKIISTGRKTCLAFE